MNYETKVQCNNQQDDEINDVWTLCINCVILQLCLNTTETKMCVGDDGGNIYLIDLSKSKVIQAKTIHSNVFNF